MTGWHNAFDSFETAMLKSAETLRFLVSFLHFIPKER